jgi:hypothetical protein
MAHMLRSARARSRDCWQDDDAARPSKRASPDTPVPSSAPGPTTQTSATTGWRPFAGTILLLVGVLNLIDGIVAVVDRDLFEQNLAGSPSLAVIDGIVAWGWLVLVIGIALVVISIPVMTGVAWARVAGMAAAGIDLVLQFTYLAHFPPWSMTLILLDVIVIFALAADYDAR